MAEPPSLFRWFRAHELRINLVLAAGALVFFVVGILSNQGLFAGPALLLLIFFLSLRSRGLRQLSIYRWMMGEGFFKPSS
jgi:hypothetical protein